MKTKSCFLSFICFAFDVLFSFFLSNSFCLGFFSRFSFCFISFYSSLYIVLFMSFLPFFLWMKSFELTQGLKLIPFAFFAVSRLLSSLSDRKRSLHYPGNSRFSTACWNCWFFIFLMLCTNQFVSSSNPVTLLSLMLLQIANLLAAYSVWWDDGIKTAGIVKWCWSREVVGFLYTSWLALIGWQKSLAPGRENHFHLCTL